MRAGWPLLFDTDHRVGGTGGWSTRLLVSMAGIALAIAIYHLIVSRLIARQAFPIVVRAVPTASRAGAARCYRRPVTRRWCGARAATPIPCAAPSSRQRSPIMALLVTVARVVGSAASRAAKAEDAGDARAGALASRTMAAAAYRSAETAKIPG
ncbi:MAG: hypothetical protein H0T79_17400 [Deltaproteobacteria bacterium]|nr:hypothetical protein [Deltaproteobacteria bacterium]